MMLPVLPPGKPGTWPDAEFRDAAVFPFGQSWRSEPEKNLRAGEVRAGVRDGALQILARFEDDDVFTTAEHDHERLWELGDVFEIFLRDPRREEYFEFHVAPNGRRLQLRFPSDRVVPMLRQKIGALRDYVVVEPLADLRTRLVPGGWEACASIPPGLFGPGEILVSFGRYDYTRDAAAPVVSSASPHHELDFHRHHEWLRLALP